MQCPTHENVYIIYHRGSSHVVSMMCLLPLLPFGTPSGGALTKVMSLEQVGMINPDTTLSTGVSTTEHNSFSASPGVFKFYCLPA